MSRVEKVVASYDDEYVAVLKHRPNVLLSNVHPEFQIAGHVDELEDLPKADKALLSSNKIVTEWFANELASIGIKQEREKPVEELPSRRSLLVEEAPSHLGQFDKLFEKDKSRTEVPRDSAAKTAVLEETPEENKACTIEKEIGNKVRIKKDFDRIDQTISNLRAQFLIAPPK